jgi:hypothetical protein
MNHAACSSRYVWAVLAVSVGVTGACTGGPRSAPYTADVGMDVRHDGAPRDASIDDDSAGDGIAPGAGGYRLCNDAMRDLAGGFCEVGPLWGIALPLRHDGASGFTTGGITALDADGDGRTDLFVTVNTDRAPALLLNRGGRFEDAAAAWGLGRLRRTLASAAVDVEGDGDPDLVVTEADRGSVRLFRNEGARFVELSETLGASDREAIAVLPADLDHDGLVDLLVGNFGRDGMCTTPLIHTCPGGLELWRQVAPWRFESMTVDAPARRVQGLKVFDWDDDGHDEVLVAADFGMLDGGSQVLRVATTPGGGLTLRDATAGSRFDHAIFGMGIGVLDVDGDGRDEVLVANFGRNVLLRRAGGVGTDVATALGADAYGMLVPGDAPRFRAFDPEHPWEGPMGRFQSLYLDESSPVFPTTKWSPVVFDVDDDGVEDVYLPAGQVGLDLLFPERPRQRPALLRGVGARLDDVTDVLRLAEPRDARSAVAADLDGDGDLDLAVLHTATLGIPGGLAVLRNDASRGHALTVVARGRGAARDGLGTRVEVRVGTRLARRRIDGALSIYGTGRYEAHVGLGDASVADEVVVRFPSGAVVRRSGVPAGRITIEE